MSELNNHWQKLARLARQAPKTAETGAPFGFATRVAARWAVAEPPAPSAWDVWEQFSLRSLVVAGALVVAVLMLQWSIFAALLAWPEATARALGAPALVLLAMGTWTVFGGMLLTYVPKALIRIPLTPLPLHVPQV